MRNQLEQRTKFKEEEINPFRSMQLGVVNKEEFKSENHNHFLRDKTATYSPETTIMMIGILILVFLKIIEMIIFGFTSFRRNLKRTIIKNQQENADHRGR